MARPSKYNEELIEKAPKYLEEWENLGQFIPSQAGLAVYLKISISCLEKWARHEDKPDFLRVLDKIEAVQRSLLLNKGLAGVFNSNICKLVLGKHGYSEKATQKVEFNDTTKAEVTEADLVERGIPVPEIDGEDIQ